MCEFGDAIYRLARDTYSSVSFDYDDAGLVAIIWRGEQWDRISSAGDWQAKTAMWREWYNRHNTNNRG